MLSSSSVFERGPTSLLSISSKLSRNNLAGWSQNSMKHSADSSSALTDHISADSSAHVNAHHLAQTPFLKTSNQHVRFTVISSNFLKTSVRPRLSVQRLERRRFFFPHPHFKSPLWLNSSVTFITIFLP